MSKVYPNNLKNRECDKEKLRESKTDSSSCLGIVKLALLGRPGVGKDTFIRCFSELFPNISFQRIRLADPLYEVQHFIYRICFRELQKDIQDGVLLNFLGKHMRSINPNVLLEPFARSVKEIESQQSIHILFCSDVRPIDAPFIKQLGFTIIHIETDPEIAIERRKRRGDLSLSDNHHTTEEGVSANMYEREISNNGTIEDFKNRIKELFNDYNWL